MCKTAGKSKSAHLSVFVALAVVGSPHAQEQGLVSRATFEPPRSESEREFYVRGLEQRALRVQPGDAHSATTIGGGKRQPGDASRSFSVQCWIRTTAPDAARMVLLSQKRYPDNSLASQKNVGWVFYMSHGTWAWNIGSGKRRITHERDNGEHMRLNDGRWHQLTMTYDRGTAQVRLYYDGVNRAIYSLADASGFDFTTTAHVMIGWPGEQRSPKPDIVPAIPAGAQKLQELVDAFESLGLGKVRSDEFVRLIVEPKRLFDERVKAGGKPAAEFGRVARIERALMQNPYTVHQAFSFMEAAPLLKIYSLKGGKVVVDEKMAKAYSERERLYPADFAIDNYAAWDRPLTAEEVRAGYARHFEPADPEPEKKRSTLTAGVWNIFHGGIHFTPDEHGWDSREAIARIVAREKIDVLMMQETYSHGDYIAAKLGYYFATTVDPDYLNQGSNISVLSRYPIKEVRVPKKSAFMNVAARVAISETQDVWVMSNWYGMRNFPDVFSFHEDRFGSTDTTPVLFGGDFNAIPHTDGGRSPASEALLGAGFTDAFRELFPEAASAPGPTHRSNRRIDQLYYKGAGIRNTSTKVIQTWPTGFPSDHYLIRTRFELR